MPHLAEVRDGIVQRVIVVQDRYGDLSAEEWAAQTLGGTWVRTSYNTRAGVRTDGDVTREPLRKNFAGRGYTYDAGRDAFLPPQPFDSWVLDEERGLWEAPVPMPDDGRDYDWDETRQRWERSDTGGGRT
jgi:hypothetical protein